MTSEVKKSIEERAMISIVIPLYNEAASLKELHGQISKVCKENRLVFEVLYIDDGSIDSSYRVLQELHKTDRRVKVIQLRRNSGKAEALVAGFLAASGSLIVTMDADLQDDPSEIPRLIEKLESGYDLVSGWKKKRQDPLSKRIPSKIWNRVTSFISGIRIHDFNCGLKIYRREVLESIEVYGELYRYIPALAHWEGFRIGEIEVNHRPRKYGKTKFGISRFINGFLDLITVLFLSKYTRRPLHLFGSIGLLTFLGGAAITIYLIILRIARISYLSNRPLLFIGVLLLILGIQFISIGLLGEMITRSHVAGHKYSIRRTLGV